MVERASDDRLAREAPAIKDLAVQPRTSGGAPDAMTAAAATEASTRDPAGADALARARDTVAAVTDPEIPVLTIADLGILRDIHIDRGVVTVTITPTYSGCPAMAVIGFEIEAALARAGFPHVRIQTTLSPAWTTDWLSAAGRSKLLAYGIAPPGPAAGRRALFGETRPACPRCGSVTTEQISEFGSTSCKSLHRCVACREPFDAFKCH
jgi:ring-1,2-phenylacetyl-CoA epoxidase subunit PaaD